MKHFFPLSQSFLNKSLRMSLLLISILLVTVLNGCSTARFHELSQLEKPQLIYKDYVFEGMGNGKVDLLVNFDVHNPNKVPIDDLQVNYQLAILDDESVVSGEFLDIDLPAEETTSVSMPVTVEMDGLLKAGTYVYLQVLSGKTEIDGKLFVEMINTKQAPFGFQSWDDTIGETFDVSLPLPKAGLDVLGDMLKNL